jgi:cytochrome c5
MRVFERIANMNTTAADAPPLFRMVTKPLPEPHRFAEGEAQRVPPHIAATGHEQHEKYCLRCGAARITVIPKKGQPWREWRAKGAATQSRWVPLCEVVSS